ncbi:MAG TPA: response regulator [Aromatoleum sp.]|uniref:ATP-binding response regulator n=1 Tax=Aromatoleum sp. TaxID=2307007 RepID=UPI002B474800|nr:response regulator [Aromatoleum sp.]HJV25000.1 response regulator [Aromatoleum sp.]
MTQAVLAAVCAVGLVALWLDNRRLRRALCAAQDEAPDIGTTDAPAVAMPPVPAAIPVALVDPAKTAFFSTASHELHAPLNAVIGFSRLMLDSATLNAGQRRNLECIHASGQRLLALVDDLVELARIEAGCLPLADEEVSIQRLVDEVATDLGAFAEGRGVTLAVEAAGLPNWLLCDRGKLRRVLTALTVDAIGSAPVDGRVTLMAHAGRVSDGRVPLQLSIIDSSAGPRSEGQARFEPFAHSDGKAGIQGTGLAMALSLRHVRLMGSEIAIDQRAGAGTVVAFALAPSVCAAPAAPAPQADAAQVERSGGGRGPKILVADDAPESRLLLCCVLEPFDVEVVEAENGALTVAQWQRHRPDLILMDAHMPELDGFEAARRIRSADPIVRIVLLSGSGGDDVRDKAYAMGADGFLTKPLDEQALYAALERHLGILAGEKGSPQAETDVWLSPEVPVPTASVRALAALSAATLDALYAAVQEVNGSKVEAVLATIGSDKAGLAEAVAAMSRDFRFQELWTLIEAARVQQDRDSRAATPDVPAGR